MRTSLTLIFALALGGAVFAADAPPSPDASDLQALTAYKKDPKDADAAFDYYFSLLKLERWPEAHHVLDDWKKNSPTDPRIADVADLLGKLEKEPDRKKREEIADSWALAQKHAAEAQNDAIKKNMATVDAGLKDYSKEQAKRTPLALPELKAQAEKEPTGDHWLAYSDALIASGDFKAALAAAEQAVKADAANTLAAVQVAQLKTYDGKNGDAIKKALTKERVNAVLRKLEK